MANWSFLIHLKTISGETLSLQSGDDGRNVALMTAEDVVPGGTDEENDAITVPDGTEHSSSACLAVSAILICCAIVVVV